MKYLNRCARKRRGYFFFLMCIYHSQYENYATPLKNFFSGFFFLFSDLNQSSKWFFILFKQETVFSCPSYLLIKLINSLDLNINFIRLGVYL